MQNMMDDIKKALNATKNKAVQKSGELYERSKIMLAITSLQNDVERGYSTIGKLVYAAYEQDDISTDEVSALCDEIKDKKEEIAALRERLSELKNVTVCPSCKAEVSTSSAYCSKCGEQLN